MNDAERIRWFAEARFGLFFHWGLYSLTGRNEWTLNTDCWTFEEYERLADRFTAENFDPARWAAVAAEADARYLVLTSRHHEGFCLFDSKTTDFTTAHRGAKRDLIAEYVRAVRAAGLKVGLYYSLVDWRFKGAWNHYRYPDSAQAMVEQAHAQVRELLTNYGPIDLLWYDGASCTDWKWADQEQMVEFWRSRELDDMAHALQPEIVINNRNGLKGDFDTPERHIEASAAGRSWESCMTIDPLSWSHVPHSPCRRSAAELVQMMLETASGGGNLLLNTGPCPDGSLNPEEVEEILAAGRWRRRHAEAFHHPRQSDFYTAGRVFGPCGQLAHWIGSDDPRVYYVATRGWTGTEFRCPRIDGKIASVELLPEKISVSFHQEEWGVLVIDNLPEEPPDELAVLFKVTFADPPRVLEIPPREEVIGCPL
ncbi:MAG: hypothetical protein HOC74_19695 [Gemmatimonadetes bacterium]|jgi:alpha-L-fucosidase|nr:hypothetical protein [Gemmatimonadota bacterium]